MQTVQIKGLTCDACVKLIIKKFMRIPGVTSTRVTLDGLAHVETNRAVDTKEYKQVLAGLPYEVVTVS